MRFSQIGLLCVGLTIAALSPAQAGKDVADIDIIVKKKTHESESVMSPSGGAIGGAGPANRAVAQKGINGSYTEDAAGAVQRRSMDKGVEPADRAKVNWDIKQNKKF